MIRYVVFNCPLTIIHSILQVLLCTNPLKVMNVIKNGHTNRRLRKAKSVVNTTAFDCIVYLLACNLIDDEKFREYIESVEDHCFDGLITKYAENGANEKFYKARTEYLLEHFTEGKQGSSTTVDCRLSIELMFEKVFANLIPSIFVENGLCECERHHHESNCDLPFVPKPFPTSTQEISLPPSKCVRCEKVYTQSVLINPVVFFNTTELRDFIEWKEIPRVIILNDKVFVLRGVVECVPPKSSLMFRHYISHSMRSNNKWQSHNNANKEILPTNMKTKILPHILMYSSINSSRLLEAQSEFDQKFNVRLLPNFHSFDTGSQVVYITNVCGPDSLFHCLACCYVDSPKFKKFCQEQSGDSQVMQMIQMLCEDASMDVVLTMRANILRSMFSSTIDNTLETINCLTSIYEIVNKLIKPVLPSVTSEIECECEKKQIHFPLVEINYAELSVNGLQSLQTSIVDKFTVPSFSDVCPTCESTRITTNILNHVIFFDVSNVERNDNSKYDLKSIKQKLSFHGRDFELKGVVEYIPGGDGHFIAHCRREDAKFYAFNDSVPKISEPPSSSLYVNSLVYVEK